MPGASTAVEPKAFELITRLLGAGEIDTVYRDLYLQRAASLLTPLLSRTDYSRLEEDKVAIDNVTRRNRAAIGRGGQY